MQPVERQVDPVHLQVVIPAVLQVVDDLQGIAKRIRQAVVLPVFAVEIKQVPSHRRGGEPTVLQQFTNIPTAVQPGVTTEGGQQVAPVPVGDARRVKAATQPVPHPKFRQIAAIDQRIVQCVEPKQLLGGGEFRCIGDVVGGAREGIERRDMGPEPAGQQDRSNRKILFPCLRDGVCLTQHLQLNRHIGPVLPECCTNARPARVYRKHGQWRRVPVVAVINCSRGIAHAD